MTDETWLPIPSSSAGDGTTVAHFSLTPVADQAGVQVTIPPFHIVPIIFVPGVMGSNLKSADGKEQVWNADSTTKLAWKWKFVGPEARQRLLSADVTQLDHDGKWYGKSATVKDEKEGIARGQGTTGKAFYSEFCIWLDNTLNGWHAAAPNESANPWTQFTAGPLSAATWNAEKPFAPLTIEEAKKAGHNYWCPVHVGGYNWTHSCQENGPILAANIRDIIKKWKNSEHKPVCEKVILISHSMGGLVTRAAIASGLPAGPDGQGSAVDSVWGIIHSVQPATGAATAYHHCHLGYEGVTGIICGANGAQVSAIFANSPGTMELLPNNNYTYMGKKAWLTARLNTYGTVKTIDFPKPTEKFRDGDVYSVVYSERRSWWGLMNEKYIDPIHKYGSVDNAWTNYVNNLAVASEFHENLGNQYHPTTYVTYGVDPTHKTWGGIEWHGYTTFGDGAINEDIFAQATPKSGDIGDAVTFSLGGTRGLATMHVPTSGDLPEKEIGDATVPQCSGSAPAKLGGANVRQSFPMTGFDHQGSYDNDDVRMATLYSIGKILAAIPSVT